MAEMLAAVMARHCQYARIQAHATVSVPTLTRLELELMIFNPDKTCWAAACPLRMHAGTPTPQ
jgi:hypothetical protein